MVGKSVRNRLNKIKLNYFRRMNMMLAYVIKCIKYVNYKLNYVGFINISKFNISLLPSYPLISLSFLLVYIMLIVYRIITFDRRST